MRITFLTVAVLAAALCSRPSGSTTADIAFDAQNGSAAFYPGGSLNQSTYDTNNVVTTTATGNKQIGKSVRAAASADTTVRVRLSQ